GVPVALVGGEREPFERLGEILLDPDAARVEDAEVVLTVRGAAIGGLAEPLRRGAVVGLAIDAFRVEHREVVHGLAVALLGGRKIEPMGGLPVLFHALAFFINAAEAI